MALLAGCAAAPRPPDTRTPRWCVPAGGWLDLASGRPRPHADVLARASRARVVLLGERHDVPEDHRWQLDVVAGLLARRPTLRVGFEMFPRDEQPVLDAWSRGELSVAQLTERTRWKQAWGPAADSVLPILLFTRRHHLPTLALNVPRALSARVAREGWASIPTADRAGVGDPAAPDPVYVDELLRTYAEHACRPVSEVRESQAAARFVEAQLLWDRAMAEALARAAASGDGVVGLVGHGHLENGSGIPRQLAALGVEDVVVLLPWDTEHACEGLRPGLADFVFGTTPLPAEATAPMRHACPPARAQPSRPAPPRPPLPR